MKITILAKAALIAVCGLSMQVAFAESSATGTFDVISGSIDKITNEYGGYISQNGSTVGQQTGETVPGDQGCNDADVISGKLITDLCWTCIFPIIVAGVNTSKIAGETYEDRIPDNAADNYFCSCPDKDGALPHFGFRTSFWEPFRIAEFERQSGCLSTINGVRLPFNKLFQGTQKQKGGTIKQADGKTFRHYHFYAFPVLVMLDLWLPKNCNPGAFMDLDIMYFSEIDPTWNYDEVSFFTNPEAALFATPLGPISCVADALASNLGHPIRQMYWCAGSWGILYPASGNVNDLAGALSETSLMAARILVALHRRGIEWHSVGKDAMCGGSLLNWLPKEQYRFNMFWPIPENHSDHPIGQTALIWGLAKLIPGYGEDPIHVVWRWLDCCNTAGQKQ